MTMPTKTTMPKVRLNLSRSFNSRVERSDRVLKVAEAFGIGLEDKEWVVYKDVEITVHQGDVIYVKGQSGSGKSCLLRDIAAGLAQDGKKVVSLDDVVLTDEPIIDQLGTNMIEATQLLAQAGISDAYLFIRKPSELSDGQRYRFKLAKLMEIDADVWVADEWGAVLDRACAKIISFNLQKVARKRGKTVIVATTHTDLIDELGPDYVITKRFQERIDVEGPLNDRT
jgi:ABC-type ATPase with predicted acetyltransferase domain